MKIKIVNSNPIDGQDSITQYVGKIYEPVELKKYYDSNIVKEMKELGEIAVYLDLHDKHVSILNKNEYVILEG